MLWVRLTLGIIVDELLSDACLLAVVLQSSLENGLPHSHIFDRVGNPTIATWCVVQRVAILLCQFF